MTTDHDDAYAAAVDAFILEPEALTADQIAALRAVDDQLAHRAVDRRADALTKAAEARHRAALGQAPLTSKGLDVAALVEQVVDEITIALAHPRQRIKTLEAANASLQQQMQELRDRLVDLEAQRVIADVNANH